MATIVADDALAEAAGAPIHVDILEIKLTACQISIYMVDRQDDNFVAILASSLVSPSYFCTCIQNRNQMTGGKKAWDTGSLLALTLLFDFRRGVRSENGSGGANG